MSLYLLGSVAAALKDSVDDGGWAGVWAVADACEMVDGIDTIDIATGTTFIYISFRDEGLPLLKGDSTLGLYN